MVVPAPNSVPSGWARTANTLRCTARLVSGWVYSDAVIDPSSERSVLRVADDVPSGGLLTRTPAAVRLIEAPFAIPSFAGSCEKGPADSQRLPSGQMTRSGMGPR